MEFHYYVYLLASGPCGYLYVGITDDLLRRMHEHKSFVTPNCHTARYNIVNLMYYEVFTDVMQAIKREKQLKKWRRNWKFNLIEKSNPTWRDLTPTL